MFFENWVLKSCQEFHALQEKLGIDLQRLFSLRPGFVQLAKPNVSLS
jgi:hypothetical protein